jgi:hypothetical protein
VTQTPVE